MPSSQMHFRLYRALPPFSFGPLLPVGASNLPTLLGIAPAPFDCTFESFAEAVAGWAGMYFEMDGSFVWTGENEQVNASSHMHEPRWQLDGMVYDASNRIQYVELRGKCPPPEWERLLGVLDPPPTAEGTAVVAHWIPQSLWIRADQLSNLFSEWSERE